MYEYFICLDFGTNDFSDNITYDLLTGLLKFRFAKYSVSTNLTLGLNELKTLNKLVVFLLV